MEHLNESADNFSRDSLDKRVSVGADVELTFCFKLRC